MTLEEVTTLKEAIKRLKEVIKEVRSTIQPFLYDNEAKDYIIKALEQEQKIGHCKECKYFEYDSVANVGGIPLIVAHEICNKWGDGCKTSEEGFCFLFEQKESENKK